MFVCQVYTQYFLSFDLHWALNSTRKGWIINSNNKLASFEKWILKVDWGWLCIYLKRSFWLWQWSITVQNTDILSSFRWRNYQLCHTFRHWRRLEFYIYKGFSTLKTVSSLNSHCRCLDSKVCLYYRNFSFWIRIYRCFLSNFFYSTCVSCLFLSVMNEFELMGLLCAKISFKVESSWWGRRQSCQFERINKITEFRRFNCNFGHLLFSK